MLRPRYSDGNPRLRYTSVLMLERIGIPKPRWIIRTTEKLTSLKAKEIERDRIFTVLAAQKTRPQAADRLRRFAREHRSSANRYQRTLDVIHFFWR